MKQGPEETGVSIPEAALNLTGQGPGLPVLSVDQTAASEERLSGHDFLVGHVYRGVETLGKELFMYFDQKALRNAAECEQKVRMMESLDVCSPKFSFSRAEHEIKQQNNRMLCDVLLDQAVLPGVGNIIKNEALFDSGLHPALKVCQLTDEHIRHLVKMTRDFTLLFYKCRKTGSPLYKHYKVYKRPACTECSGSITVCRLGDHNRMTYFCSQCQKADPQLINLSKLPARNSLIGWAYGRGSCSNEHVAQKSEEEWTCMCCTLINKPSAEICDACLTSRPEVPKMESFEDSAAFNTNLMKYPCNDFRKPSTEIKINRKTVFGTTTLVLTDLGNKTVLRNDTQWADLDFPFCNHGKRCVMKTVLKIGPNNGKNFFVCRLGNEKQCGFFQWAENGREFQLWESAWKRLLSDALPSLLVDPDTAVDEEGNALTLDHLMGLRFLASPWTPLPQYQKCYASARLKSPCYSLEKHHNRRRLPKLLQPPHSLLLDQPHKEDLMFLTDNVVIFVGM
ncbi:hypothetical protein DUI87_09077 [Hirundo rustica rustica]|uniref:Endonuclease 8-like 3 n=1 Tax=Hirundo rustica rustica TaxID=333673 RepID=A0A3M0KLQ9_HIRRU|nr:hypothetical protein DUI87_09077 [Hirundo rustica rustica]